MKNYKKNLLDAGGSCLIRDVEQVWEVNKCWSLSSDDGY